MKRIFRIVAVVFIIIYCYRELPAYLTSEQKAGQVGRLVVLPAKAMPLPKVVIIKVKKVATKAKEIVSPTPRPSTPVKQCVRKTVKNDFVCPCREVEDDIVLCISSVEAFKPTAYQCAGQWLVGFGQSRIYGHKVNSESKISRSEAKAEMREYLKGVYKVINDSIRVQLTPEQYVACCMIAYSTGNGGFGRSEFVKAINAGMPPEECVKKLRKGWGGLTKRRWLESALFTGKIKLDDLRGLNIGGLYDLKESFYFHNGTWDLSDEKVQTFLESPKVRG